MLLIPDTDPTSLADAADACRRVADQHLAAATEGARQLEAGELGGGDRRQPSVAITRMLATAARLRKVADALEDARPVEPGAAPPAPAVLPPAHAGGIIGGPVTLARLAAAPAAEVVTDPDVELDPDVLADERMGR